jgi:pentatricopeptide repeat protein
MYASCGGLEEAYKVLNGMANKDVISWSSLITGLALSGSNVGAEKLLAGMRVQSVTPDDTLYATLMSSYTHRGLVKESLLSLKNMGDIKTTSKLYNCLIDLFSRTGQLLEAKDLLHTMPSSPGGIVCSSLLANSRTYGDYTLSKAMFESNVCTRAKS